MRILILGASGYAGSKIREVLSTEFENVYGTYCTENLTYKNDSFMFQYKLGDDKSLKKILDLTKPDIVISSIRGEFDLVLKSHEFITNILSKQQNKLMLFISTSNVFDGALEKTHVETDATRAESEYGQFKIECENLLLNKLDKNSIIIRVPEIWGINCSRLINLENNIKNNTPIQSYKNIYVNYTTNKQIAEWILYIIKNDLRGIFHIGSKDICEYIEFQNQLIEKLKLSNLHYNIEKFDTTLYQAVIPNRKEIPDYLQKTISDIIDEVAK